jgi:hypothetical protein
MATAALTPDLAMGLAGKVSAAIDTGRVEGWSADDVATAVLASRFLRELLARVQHSVVSELRQGTDAQGFADRYATANTDLETIQQTVKRVLEKTRANGLPAQADELVSTLEAVGDDITRLRQFVSEALAKANAPARPVDWIKVQEIEAACGWGRPVERQPGTASPIRMTRRTLSEKSTCPDHPTVLEQGNLE